jgi:hypothetical protein
MIRTRSHSCKEYREIKQPLPPAACARPLRAVSPPPLPLVLESAHTPRQDGRQDVPEAVPGTDPRRPDEAWGRRGSDLGLAVSRPGPARQRGAVWRARPAALAGASTRDEVYPPQQRLTQSSLLLSRPVLATGVVRCGSRAGGIPSMAVTGRQGGWGGA